ncbi:RING-H2 finger protein ATL73 [Beta vulgaris subsp. vulgaris]|uniref:RING-H2 finger protein ATL73 n=1 Tax=Beta vulgaris subsp. vulgaris TaxID=3555 RepID=UPI0020367C25|nr:RING-H2 finger protein ATL73 [Beta vulgaris subsp. vulgaris]
MAWNPPRRHHLSDATPPTAATPYGSKPRVVGDVDIDANMVIILAVLLFALLCALGLNSVVRCALRCTGRHDHNHNHNHSDVGALGGVYVSAATRGLKRSTIRQIPTTLYHITSSGRTINNVMSTECMICLGEFIEGENIKVLPKCKHGFHSKCIDTWLLSHSTCPTCRQSLSEWARNGAILVSIGQGNGTNFSTNEVSNGDDGAQRH